MSCPITHQTLHEAVHLNCVALLVAELEAALLLLGQGQLILFERFEFRQDSADQIEVLRPLLIIE